MSGSVVGPWNEATPALAATLGRLACVSFIVRCPQHPEGRQGAVGRAFPSVLTLEKWQNL